jgi:hypothetical protein
VGQAPNKFSSSSAITGEPVVMPAVKNRTQEDSVNSFSKQVILLFFRAFWGKMGNRGYWRKPSCQEREDRGERGIPAFHKLSFLLQDNFFKLTIGGKDFLISR